MEEPHGLSSAECPLQDCSSNFNYILVYHTSLVVGQEPWGTWFDLSQNNLHACWWGCFLVCSALVHLASSQVRGLLFGASGNSHCLTAGTSSTALCYCPLWWVRCCPRDTWPQVFYALWGLWVIWALSLLTAGMDVASLLSHTCTCTHR